MDITRFNVSCDYCSNNQEASFILGKRCIPCCKDCIDLVNNPRESTMDERKLVYKEMKALIKYSLGLSTPSNASSNAYKALDVCNDTSELCKETVINPASRFGSFIKFNDSSIYCEDNIIFKLNFTPEIGVDLSYTALSNGLSSSFKKKMNAVLTNYSYNSQVQNIIMNTRNDFN
jgi:hypothetical protein